MWCSRIEPHLAFCVDDKNREVLRLKCPIALQFCQTPHHRALLGRDVTMQLCHCGGRGGASQKGKQLCPSSGWDPDKRKSLSLGEEGRDFETDKSCVTREGVLSWLFLYMAPYPRSRTCPHQSLSRQPVLPSPPPPHTGFPRPTRLFLPRRVESAGIARSGDTAAVLISLHKRARGDVRC